VVVVDIVVVRVVVGIVDGEVDLQPFGLIPC
jgi:hypothetical protein